MKAPPALSLLSTTASLVSLALLLVIPLVSITASPNHVPSLEFCTIDASATKVTIGDDELVGLPDANDYSRQKQVYKVFLLNYCSGTREAGSQDTDMDYCSETGEEIWDLLDPWIVWGVKLKSDGSASFGWLDRGPDWLWIAYIAGGIFGSLSVISALVPVHRLSFAKWPVVIVASVSDLLPISGSIFPFPCLPLHWFPSFAYPRPYSP